ncbi:MAG: S-methyl-5-thioribose-1-phosphate isomerase [Chloroflexi bacterium RBG_13_60_13]|nr:MAG: S-methyl-5-thioribose-1-phosphate isomerase [Chloroflexi bacterium RBG_13_60_13]
MEPVVWLGDAIEIIDQTRLPWEEVRLRLSTYQEVAAAIREMRVRGAPVIGIVAACGIALGAQSIETSNKEQFLVDLNRVAGTLASTRPTAVNLFKAVDRMLSAARTGEDVATTRAALVAEAKAIHADERQATRSISRFGAELIRDGSTIITHCNAGPLATGGYGTALGVIIEARRQNKAVAVLATETRPLLQGARLTVWELMREGIPVTLITDSMAGHFMTRGDVDCAIVGADRIAANGDVANKIGTYALAVLARENAVPFYVAAPTSTIDLSLASGDGIPIEQRGPDEVTLIRGVPITPEGVPAANPAFDVTPHRYVSAIVTDKGTLREPYGSTIPRVFSSQSSNHK